MKKKLWRTIAPLALVALAGAGLAGCSGSDSGGSGDKVTITVGNEPTSDQTAALKVYKKQVADFEKANPNIKVNPTTTKYDAQTFQALVASGKMPDVISVPFTDIQSLIARGQVADITSEIKADPQASKVNPTVAKVAQAGGKTYGAAIGAYTMALIYNRALFTKAGLDPDKPPTTWEEVRTDAKTITDKTGAQGYAAMTTNNTGGWSLTSVSYAFGHTLESADGKKATVDNEATKKALELYQQMRWDDNSFGSNFLLNQDDVFKQMAAGNVGMMVNGSDGYNFAVTNDGMNKDDFGLAPLPQEKAGLGTLGGGSIAIFKPKATKEQISAGLKYVDWIYYRQYFDKSTAVSTAKASVADGSAVGAPGLQLFDNATNDRYLGWVKDEINVPRENYKAYLKSTTTLPLVPEPMTQAQQLYGILDNVVQAVLTNKDTDIDSLLKTTQTQAQSAVAGG
jgi:ABC-type glycerol-3-phosphate transport system substrate-binding protein